MRETLNQPGFLFPPLHYTLSDLELTRCTPAACSMRFGTQISIPNFGSYHPTLQLNFDTIWVNWTHPDQQQIFLFFDGTAERWNASGPAQRTVETATPAVPEPSTWAMLILGFAGIGYMTYRRRKQVTVSRRNLVHPIVNAARSPNEPRPNPRKLMESPMPTPMLMS